MVVDDFNVFRSSINPAETDTPLGVDPDGMLSSSVPTQRLQPVAGRNPQVLQIDGSPNCCQTTLRRSHQISRKSLWTDAFGDGRNEFPSK
jgi:hypothetical protein